MNKSELEEQLQSNFDTSFWLRAQLEETKKRDIVDALRDAELLVAVLQSRLALLEVFKDA